MALRQPCTIATNTENSAIISVKALVWYMARIRVPIHRQRHTANDSLEMLFMWVPKLDSNARDALEVPRDRRKRALSVMR